MVWELKTKRAFILENLPELVRLVRSTVQICHQHGLFHSSVGVISIVEITFCIVA